MNPKHRYSDIARYKKSIMLGILFILSFTLIYIYIRIQNIVDFPFDSGDYWDLGLKFLSDNGKFSFINYFDDRRGYFYPLILFFIRSFSTFIGSNPFQFFWIISSIFFSTFTVILLPLYFENIFNIKLNMVSRALIIITLFYFWRGSFSYPLSDFPSLFIILLSALFLKKIYEAKNQILKCFYAILSGIFLYAGYSIRPIYLPLILIYIIFIIAYNKIRLRIRILIIVLFVFGILLTSIPQIIINSENSNNFSPLIETEWRGQDLFFFNLKEGLRNQKYLTNINTDIYPSNKVVFREDLADQLRIEEVNSYSDYIKLVASNPFISSLIYSKHIFNGISVFYPEIYVKNIFQNRNLFLLINYTLWFTLLMNLFRGRYKITKLLPEQRLLIITLIIPIILMIPLQAVSRFYLPLFILCYGFVYSLLSIKMRESDTTSIGSAFKKIKRADIISYLKYSILYIIFILFCFIISTNTFLNLI